MAHHIARSNCLSNYRIGNIYIQHTSSCSTHHLDLQCDEYDDTPGKKSPEEIRHQHIHFETELLEAVLVLFNENLG